MMTLDKQYRDELLLALRLRDISGARVGEVLAEVEAHVADTGEEPVKAFGTPKEYAAKVASQLSTESGKPATLPHAAGALTTGTLAYVGIGGLMNGLGAEGPVVPLTLADVLSGGIFLALMTVSIFLLFRAATTVTNGKLYAGLGAGIFACALAVLIFGKTLFDNETALVEVSHWVSTGVGVAALAGAAYLLKGAFRRGRVVDPR